MLLNTLDSCVCMCMHRASQRAQKALNARTSGRTVPYHTWTHTHIAKQLPLENLTIATNVLCRMQAQGCSWMPCKCMMQMCAQTHLRERVFPGLHGSSWHSLHRSVYSSLSTPSLCRESLLRAGLRKRGAHLLVPARISSPLRTSWL